jgi:mRNA interferase MazF
MRRGTIVLTPFPFTDLHGNKVRPAVIVSSDARSGDDIILAFISSVYDPNRLLETDLAIDTKHRDFQVTGLKRSSVIKADKLATVHHTLILGELGSLSNELVSELNTRLKLTLDLH